MPHACTAEPPITCGLPPGGGTVAPCMPFCVPSLEQTFLQDQHWGDPLPPIVSQSPCVSVPIPLPGPRLCACCAVCVGVLLLFIVPSTQTHSPLPPPPPPHLPRSSMSPLDPLTTPSTLHLGHCLAPAAPHTDVAGSHGDTPPWTIARPCLPCFFDWWGRQTT